MISSFQMMKMKLTEMKDDREKFKTINFIEIKCIMDIWDNKFDIQIIKSDIPPQLLYCFKELDNVIIPVVNDFKIKFANENSKISFENFRSTQYLIFKKEEWAVHGIVIFPFLPKNF